MQISCPPKLVHVAHSRDPSSLPDLRIADSLHLRDAEDRPKAGVMEALELSPVSRRHAPSLASPKKSIDDDCLVELDSNLEWHVPVLEYAPPPRIELLSRGIDTTIHIEIVAQIVGDPGPEIFEPLAE